MNAPGPLTLLDEPTDVVPTQAIVHHLPPPVTGTGALTPVALMLQAQQNGTSLETLERMWALQVAFEEREAMKAHTKAMSAFKRNPPAIFKDKHVKFTTAKGITEYDHATLGHVTKQIVAGLAEHGISSSWNTKRADSRVFVTCTLTHELGHSESITLDGPLDDSGGKNNIQALGSTITYLQRYTLLSITGLAVEDGSDDDGAGAGNGVGSTAGSVGQFDGPPWDVEPPPPPPPPPPPAEYPQARFDANLQNWRDVIESGRKTPDELIAMVESKGQPLTSAQKLKLRGIKKAA